MPCREVTTQAAFDAAAAAGDCCHVRGTTTVQAGGSARVEARDSATVQAGDSARVVAWDSATVVARDSATVEAGGSATVEAWGSARVVARGSATVEAGPLVAVHQHSAAAVIRGGVVIRVTPPTTAAEWCAQQGVAVVDDIATVYKAVDDDYRSPHGTRYAPGSAPEADDWDEAPECGGGLHFAPSPAMARVFHRRATRYVACGVALADMRAPRANDHYPQKIKARRVATPCIEVDVTGEAVS